jgi:hypothetical protein
MTTSNPSRGTEGDFSRDPVKAAENKRYLSILQDAVYGGWELPPESSRRLPSDLQAIVDDPNTSTRDRIRALECLAALRKDRLDALMQLDKVTRLDAGQATDRVEMLESMTDAQLAAVARVLATPAPAALPAPKPAKGRRKRKA